jgi:hypothetical protein
MDISTFLITVFCMTDDWFKTQRVRQRGSQPQLSDSEVVTMEIVGAFLGLETEIGIYDYFRRHWGEWFPRLKQVHRTTFTRQAANLWAFKEAWWQALLSQLSYDPHLSTVDSFPVPVCRLGRAHRCKRLRGLADFGYDEGAKHRYYGLRAHVRICYPGIIVGVELTPASVHDLHPAEDLAQSASGLMLGDRNYWSPQVRERLARRGVQLLTPYKVAKREPFRLPRSFTYLRRRIETVFGQLVGRFQAKVVWARDVWHLSSRWLRLILSHTFAVFCCQQAGLSSSLAFAHLLSD